MPYKLLRHGIYQYHFYDAIIQEYTSGIVNVKITYYCRANNRTKVNWYHGVTRSSVYRLLNLLNTERYKLAYTREKEGVSTRYTETRYIPKRK